jgi:hypothetical protein
MEKETIETRLLEGHQRFCMLIAGLSDQAFMTSQNGKWTPGQHIEHLCISVFQTSRAFKFPKFVVRMLFGKANRPSKTYSELVNKYKDKIAAGGVATGAFVPKSVALDQKPQLVRQLEQLVPQMVKRLRKYSEQDLDSYILPHPLLGKITVREMLYFTIYHVEHHEVLTLRDLNA